MAGSLCRNLGSLCEEKSSSQPKGPKRVAGPFRSAAAWTCEWSAHGCLGRSSEAAQSSVPSYAWSSLHGMCSGCACLARPASPPSWSTRYVSSALHHSNRLSFNLFCLLPLEAAPGCLGQVVRIMLSIYAGLLDSSAVNITPLGHSLVEEGPQILASGTSNTNG
jgi:hypothetical protein